MAREGLAGRLAWRAAGAVAAVCVFARCAQETAAPPNIPNDRLYIALGVSPRAATLAVGEGQQLTVHGLTPTGDTLPGGALAVFGSSDSTSVTISPTGVITGIQPTASGPVLVTVSLQLEGVTHVDTVYASVTATRQAAASLSIQPAASVPAGQAATVPAIVRDSSGQVLTGVSPYFSVPAGNTAGAVIDPLLGTVTSSVPGVVEVHASVTAYGVALQDSVQYTFTTPLIALVILTPNGSGISATNGGPAVDSEHVGVGGSAVFLNETTDTTVSIIFADSTAVLGANLHMLGSSVDPIGAVTFPTAGTYTWSLTGAPNAVTGVVVVQ